MRSWMAIVWSVFKKKVSKGVVSQALKGFGCKLSKANWSNECVTIICRQNQSGAIFCRQFSDLAIIRRAM